MIDELQKPVELDTISRRVQQIVRHYWPYLFYFILLLVSIYFRIPNHPDWIDEIKFFEIVRQYNQDGVLSAAQNTNYREIVPAIMCYAFGLDNPTKIRWLFVFFGVALVMSVPLVIRDRRSHFAIMVFLSIAPLFSYWSVFARPYIIAAYFVLLSWRWPILMLPAILTNPIAITGINLTKSKWWTYYTILFAASYIYYQSMPLSDCGHLTNINFLLNARRIYVVPVLAIVLYVFTFNFSWFKRIQFSTKRLVKKP